MDTLGPSTVTMPYAFYKSGYIAGILVTSTILCALINYVSFVYVANMSIRAEALTTIVLSKGMCVSVLVWGIVRKLNICLIFYRHFTIRHIL